MGAFRAAVVDSDQQDCREICALLKQAKIPVAPLFSLEALSEHLKKEQVRVLIVDLDTLPVDNSFFRRLKKHYPNLHILCLANGTYHPRLEEAMGSHICASLAKPINPEELFYWLKAIAEIEPVNSLAF
jgi:DNA-binding NtrC family response regulator